jgi:Xaa-Pro aminopeptidase
VKLEEQVLITETGIEVLSKFPFDEALLDEPMTQCNYINRVD